MPDREHRIVTQRDVAGVKYTCEGCGCVFPIRFTDWQGAFPVSRLALIIGAVLVAGAALLVVMGEFVPWFAGGTGVPAQQMPHQPAISGYGGILFAGFVVALCALVYLRFIYPFHIIKTELRSCPRCGSAALRTPTAEDEMAHAAWLRDQREAYAESAENRQTKRRFVVFLAAFAALVLGLIALKLLLKFL